jgi:transposase InsO family protein
LLHVLYVFIVLAHDRRRILHFNITDHPTAVWAAQQIVEAFPEDNVPHYLVRDRDGIYGAHFRSRVEGIGIEQIPIAPKSPWQNCYVERVIGSIRRECLNHIIVVNDQHCDAFFANISDTIIAAEHTFRWRRTHLKSRAVQSNKSEGLSRASKPCDRPTAPVYSLRA